MAIYLEYITVITLERDGTMWTGPDYLEWPFPFTSKFSMTEEFHPWVEHQNLISWFELFVFDSVAEPPELFQLKCIGHHHKGNTDSNALQTEQFLVCWVTSRYNHRISDRTSIPRMKASLEILQLYILQHGHSSYYNMFKVLLQVQT